MVTDDKDSIKKDAGSVKMNRTNYHGTQMTVISNKKFLWLQVNRAAPDANV